MMMRLGERLSCSVDATVGEECWGVVGGEGTGSVILLSIGERFLRRRPLTNPHLSELCRFYDAAYSLRIMCPWRIDSPSKVVAGSHMCNANDGPMVEGLKEICGQKILTVLCLAPAYDITIHFENQMTLMVHCSDIDCNYDEFYSFGTPSGYYVVGPDGNISFEE
ncbi:hypothetical protein HUX88_24865 [Duganella sp. BJB1802]|uniref:hypothetical protein n=1 Tax=unclassified Duganella TaxID=2636909 RepID=UPI0011C190F1|nr:MULTISPECIES: hypothetical protein [unclassified Duganella]NVD73742.1 hypothetical protein [Duganella sp. BJB1802]